MRAQFAFAIFSLPVSATLVFAQAFEEQAICAAINKPGLFYARSQTPYQYQSVNGVPLAYERDARFVLITAPTPQRRDREYEGVWHVRTQTIAELSKRANKAHVYRPPVKTRCSREVLQAFEGGDRLVGLTRYLDHHLSDPNQSRVKDYDLTRRLHMPIEDGTAGNCVWTDDDKKFDVNALYGFSDVNRRDLDTAFEVATSFTRRAFASPVSYHGLSSQFAYRETPNGACVSFASPIPTGPVPRGWFGSAYDDARQAAANWKPKSTLLVIKRLEGRRVIPVASTTITWADR